MHSEAGKGFSSTGQNGWVVEIPDDQWEVYLRVIRAVQQRGIPFALGGAFAVAAYTGRWRNTKDLDIYVQPQHRDDMVGIVTNAGLVDYFDQLPYQRHWIYRAVEGDIIIDIIWAMANDWDQVDEHWVTRGPQIAVRGVNLRVIPVEEIIWAKIYVLQKDRCDWPDLFNLIHAAGDRLDWEHLLARLGQDLPLLRGVLSVFAWLHPARALLFPGWLWGRLHLPEPEPGDTPEATMHRRAGRLDSRPWFIPNIPPGEQPFSSIT